MRTLQLLALGLISFSALAQGPLTNADIVRMVGQGIPADTIIRTIQTAPVVSLRVSPEFRPDLEKAGVPRTVIDAMLTRVMADESLSSAPSQQETRGSASSQQGTTPQTQPLEYQGRGMWDLNLAGSVMIPHASAASTTGFAQVTAGRFVSRGSETVVGVRGDFSQGVQDAVLLGGYRYYFKTGDPRLLPFVGAAVGGNFLHVPGLTDKRFVADAGAGLRYFLARHVAIELTYDLLYAHFAGASFSQSTSSTIAVGFSHTWGRTR
jgi:hypothetical protein